MRMTVVTIGLAVAVSAVLSAQTTPGDEQQIRALIAKMDAGQTQGIGTKDRIFWSAAYKRPVVSPAQGEEVPSDRRISERKPESQRNQTTPIRIEIAKSGDLAYEVSDHILSFEMKDGRKVSLPASVMRVWRKEDGQWKVAAQFSHNHYQEPTAPKP
jgi:hypothetical protein